MAHKIVIILVSGFPCWEIEFCGTHLAQGRSGRRSLCVCRPSEHESPPQKVGKKEDSVHGTPCERGSGYNSHQQPVATTYPSSKPGQPQPHRHAQTKAPHVHKVANSNRGAEISRVCNRCPAVRGDLRSGSEYAKALATGNFGGSVLREPDQLMNDRLTTRLTNNDIHCLRLQAP